MNRGAENPDAPNSSHGMNSGVLRTVRTRLAAGLAFRTLLLVAAVAAAVALGLLLADAALDLSESLRVGAGWIVGLSAVAALAVGLWKLRALQESRLAPRLEQLFPSLGTRLTNAVQLASGTCCAGVSWPRRPQPL